MEDKIISYGGQAVIEGVMMRGRKAFAIAMRAPDGNIVIHKENLAAVYRSRITKIPFLRGVILLWDGWSPLARHDEQAFKVALSVLGGRANADRGCKFAALLRGDGPPIDVPELPAKH